MKPSIPGSVLLGLLCTVATSAVAADALPFQQKVEVYRDKEGEVKVFTVRLEQPFLADEFEKSNYLRLTSSDNRAYLIYPKETRFEQKHAEFYGRLRGEGTVSLKLSYETVTENPDGSRRVEVREGDVEVTIPTEPVGPESVFLDWARQQNLYFAQRLRYYPEESFYQYCLLQSKARYGVEPPPIAGAAPDRTDLETNLYQVFSGSLAIQEVLQRQTLGGSARRGDLNVHVSTLAPPDLRSLPYEKLLDEKRTRDGVEPKVHAIARLVPDDQYFLHFNSIDSAYELLDLAAQWGNGLLRLFTVRAMDGQLESKFDDQLCLRRDALVRLFADDVVAEVALTGADTFVAEGTDVTVIFRVKRPDAFREAAAGWLDAIRERYPQVVDRTFNYRGHEVSAHYTNDRVVSAFAAEHDDYVIYSNSHRAIRRVIDVAVGIAPSLHDALDYRYVTTIMAPSEAADSGYLFASEAFLRRLVGPASKISEKRRLECFSNLVMLNNASLFFRMEYGRSPQSLSELIQGRFVDPDRIVCPHGGGYAFDAENDTCTCSLHNRLKYLTPNVELSVLNVSQDEAAEYERYKQRYQATWREVFDPLAVRITVGPRLKLETCVLPFANGSLYRDLRAMVDKNPRPIGTARIAPSAVFSLVMVPGRARIADLVNAIPGVAEVLRADPTLTDLSWLGDRVGLHLCDGETILEVDPARLRPLDVPLVGRASLPQQSLVAAALWAASMPVYATVDVENRDSATRLLERLARQIFLKRNDLAGMQTRLDAYRLPDYRQHAVYVFSGQVYAVKLRLHVALVGDQLVAATKPEILRQAIDAGAGDETNPAEAHVLLRVNRRALGDLYDDVELYWAEKSRIACHRNIISIYNLAKLYETPMEEIPRLSNAKYGVRYFCPDHGDYAFEPERDRVVCSVHGNREASRQNLRLDRESSFSQFIESLDEITAALRFRDEALIATVEIVRSGPPDE